MSKEIVSMLAVAAAVVAVGYFVSRKGAAAPIIGGTQIKSPETILNGADPGEPGWGWSYYTNGVAISPEGVYYLNGQPVWKP